MSKKNNFPFANRFFPLNFRHYFLAFVLQTMPIAQICAQVSDRTAEENPSGQITESQISEEMQTSLLVQPEREPAANARKRNSAPNKKVVSPMQGKTMQGKTIGEVANISLGPSSKSQVQIPAFSQALFSNPVRNSAVDLSRVQPPSSQQFFKGDSDKAELEKVTNKQIDEMFGLTQRFRNSPRRGELWLRLAELYVEKASLIHMRIQDEYDRKIRQNIQQKSNSKPKLNLGPSLEYNRKAIQLYEWFVRDFPRDPKLDQALFFLGYNHYELNQVKQGTNFYTRLVKEFPRSNFVTESHFALAEFYFENEKWKLAHENYARVTTNTKHRLYSFSQYKQAWSSYRSGESKRALREMQDMIANTRGSSERAKLDSEAIRDLVLIYADAGRAETAISYFKQWAGDSADLSLERLAYLYADRGQRDGARQLFNYLIQKDPTSEKAFDFKYQIVRSFASATSTKDFKEEFLSWIQEYSEGSRWYEANRDKKDFLENAERLRESTLRNWTLQQHQAAQKTRSRAAQLLAAEGYQLYLSQFSRSPQLGEMHFYYAEVLYDLGRFDEAAIQYRWVVENAPTNRFASKAAENIIIALERTLPSDRDIQKRIGKNLDPVALSKESQNFVQTGTWFMQKFPQHPKRLELQFRLGRLYYQHNQFDTAIVQFQDVVRRDPKSKPAEFSANLMLDIFNLKKDYDGLNKVGSELLQIPAFQGTKAGREIQNILARAHFKKIQSQDGKIQASSLAEQFEQFGRKNHDSEIGSTALFNAAITYEKAEMPARAMELHAAVLKSGADPDLKRKSRKIIAQLYQDSGQLELAENSYRAAAVEEKNPQEAALFYFNAALLDEALGRSKEAVANYEQFFQKHKGADRADALWQMAVLFKDLGQFSRAIDAYKNYLGFSKIPVARKIEASFWVSTLSEKLNQTKQSQQFKKQTLIWQKEAAPNKKGVGANWAAKLKLEDIKEKEKEFRAIRIPANPSKQGKVVQDKIYRMNRLNSELSEVIQFDSAEEIVGALEILASANHHMATSLLQAPMPPGMKPEEIKAYQAGIQQVVAPFEAKARESVKVGLERAHELEVYGAPLARIERLATEIAPDLKVRGREVGVESNFVHWMGL